MSRLVKANRSYDEFLKDKILSLRAKEFLVMVLANNITTGFEVQDYCSDSKEDIEDIILELKICKYIRYNPETNTLDVELFHIINEKKFRKIRKN